MKFTDWINAQITSVQSTLLLLFSLAVIIIAAMQILKSGFSIGRVLMVALTAGVVIWLVQLNGLQQIARMISSQAG